MEQLSRLYQAFQNYQASVKGDPFHDSLLRSLLADASSPAVCQEQCTAIRWDPEWIEAFETALPFVEKAIEEQRRFIESFSEIRRVDQARRVSVESVRHLAEHSNLITHLDGDDVIPDKILIVQREDNYAIYENRFLYTLVRQMQDFLHQRYVIAQEISGLRQMKIRIDREGKVHRLRLHAYLDLTVDQLPPEGQVSEDALNDLSDLERVELLAQRTHRMCSAPLLQKLKGCTPVMAPIVRTNVFKSNENFKQALLLFDFLQQYQKPGYEIINDQQAEAPLPESLRDNLCEMMILEALGVRVVMDPELAAGLEEDLLLSRQESELALRREYAAREQASRSLAAQARREETAVRNREIAIREEIISGKDREIAEAQGVIADQKQDLAAAAAERDKMKERIQALERYLQSAEDALECSRQETRDALSQAEQERIQRRQDLEQAKGEIIEAKRQAASEIQAVRTESQTTVSKVKIEAEQTVSLVREKAAQEIQFTKKSAEEAVRAAAADREEAVKARNAADQRALKSERELRELKEKYASLQKRFIQAQKSAEKKKEKHPSPHLLKEAARKIWNS